MFIRLFFLLTAVCFAWFAVTQLMIPIWKSGRLFPLFRKKTREEILEEQLEQIEEEKRLLRLQEKISEGFTEASRYEPPSMKNRSVEHEK
jgi:hypothetical protein